MFLGVWCDDHEEKAALSYSASPKQPPPLGPTLPEPMLAFHVRVSYLSDSPCQSHCSMEGFVSRRTGDTGL